MHFEFELTFLSLFGTTYDLYKNNFIISSRVLEIAYS
jgi:hypothetical protein